MLTKDDKQWSPNNSTHLYSYYEKDPLWKFFRFSNSFTLFQGLENNLRELVLEGNQFRLFPISAVKILKKLQSLNLSKNSVRNITTDSFTRLGSIKYLDMSDNMFDKINRDTLMSLPKLQKLSFASNEIQEVDSGRMSKHTNCMN